jgi:hypothetical protein
MWLSRLNSQWVLLPAVAVIVLLAWWLRTRDPRAKRALIVATVIFTFVFLFQLLRPETPAEAMERKLKVMADAVLAKDVDKIFQQISDQFDMPPFKKTDLRATAQRLIDTGELTSVEVWRFKDAKWMRHKSGAPDTGTIEFLVKPKGPNLADSPGYRCVAEFVFDEDRQWRLQTFDVYPFNSTQKLQIPFVPIP